MIDVVQQIESVHRGMQARATGDGDLRVASLARTYAAPVEDVWDAVTNPERIPRWFLPVSGDLREGGHYALEGNASGKIERCDPPHRFAATWEYGDQASWIEVRLSAEPAGGTRLTLEHTAVVDEHFTEFGPGATGIGWDLSFIGLTLHFASGGEPVDPAAFMEWMGTEEARRFMTLSGDAWRAAHVAGGADPDTAGEAARRTLAFYGAAPDDR